MDANVGQILEKRARLTPNRVGWIDGDTGDRYRYSDLNDRANRAVNFLRQQHDISQGDRVSLLALNGLHYSDLYYGLGKIGAILAPLNWRLAAPELEYILGDCAPEIVLYDEKSHDELNQLKDSYTDGEWVHLSEYEQALEQASSDRPEPTEPISEDDPHAILYTSGTTGRPKGAILPHRMVLWNSTNTVVSWGLTAEDVAPIFTPQFHSGGLNVVMSPLYHLGGTVVVPEQFDPEHALQLIERNSATVVFMVPAMFQMMSELDQFDEADLSSIKFLISGGAPCSESIKLPYQNRGLVFKEGYGLTEAGINCFSQTAADSLQREGSVGKPIFHGEGKIVDDHNDQVGVDEVGELLLSGPHVFSGYWEKPEETEQAFIDDWFHTGDLARRDEDGYFYIEGRKKDMIISGGENIYLAEVERVLKLHPDVADAALFGVPHDKWGEVGRAVIVVEQGQSVSDQELIEHCKENLAGYKVPKSFVTADSLPRNTYGKLERDKVEQEFSPDRR